MNFSYAFWALLPTMVTLFWAITLSIDHRKDGIPKKWLGVFMFSAFVLYLCHSLVFLGEHKMYFHYKSLYHLMGLSVYPLFYNYIQLMTCKIQTQKTFFIHILPALIISVLFLIFSHDLSETKIYSYIHHLITKQMPEGENPTYPSALFYIFKSSRILFAIQAILYPLFCLRLIRKYDYKIKNFYSNVDNIKLDWLKILVYAMLTTGLMSFSFNLIGRNYFVANEIIMIPSLTFSTLLYIIGLQGNHQKSYVTVLQKDIQEENQRAEENSTEEDKSRYHILKKDLIQLMEEKQLFLDPHLKITDLCQELNSNRSYISNLINDEFGSNFNEYVNQHRVQYAQKILSDPKNVALTLAHIAEHSGFGSVSTFNRNFKKNVGLTPHEFRKKQLRKS